MGLSTSSLRTTATATRDFTLGLDFLRNWEVVNDDTPRSTVTETYLTGTPAIVLSQTDSSCRMVVDGKSFSVTLEQFRKGWTLHQVKRKDKVYALPSVWEV